MKDYCVVFMIHLFYKLLRRECSLFINGTVCKWDFSNQVIRRFEMSKYLWAIPKIHLIYKRKNFELGMS